MLIVLGALATLLLLGGVIIFLLRSFFATRLPFGGITARTDYSWRNYKPIQRLLDPADFNYLRRKGMGADRIRKLRSERRRIYRLCLRSLAADFNQVHRALSLLMVHSHADRPDLAAELARQRFVFYRNLLLVEFRLTLHACGVEMPTIDLCAPLAFLQAELQQLSPSAMTA